MQPDVHIDVEGLRRTGIRIRTPLVAVDQAINQEAGRLAVTGPAAAWTAGAELTQTAAAWRTVLNQLAQRVKTLGEDLVAGANEFEAADQAAAHSFNIPMPVPAPPVGSHNFPIPSAYGGDGVGRGSGQ